MRSQGFASPCGYGFSGTRLSIQQHAALGASRQELVHSSRVVKLYMAVPRHASTSGTRSSRARVRPRSEHAAGTQRRTVLLPVGASGALPSFLDTRLASSVMAGDDHMEQLSLVQQRGVAATRAAVRSHGHGISNGSLGGKGGRAGKHERRHQQRAQRGGDRGRSSSGAATVSSPATATHQEEVSSLSTASSLSAAFRAESHPPARKDACVLGYCLAVFVLRFAVPSKLRRQSLPTSPPARSDAPIFVTRRLRT